jgi:hypothetical protein
MLKENAIKNAGEFRDVVQSNFEQLIDYIDGTKA